MIVSFKENHLYNSPLNFYEILKNISVEFSDFPLQKCDERTFYVTISLRSGKFQVECDLIFLLDRPNPIGAISLNEKYDNTRAFFKNYFNYDLLYSDELQIAKQFTKTPSFKTCLNEFSKLYPKFIRKDLFI